MSHLGIKQTSTWWSRWKSSVVLLIIYIISQAASQNKNFKISPKPCIVGGYEGTCMFVWECIKSEGVHLGMCMDGFMFGSCCGHNLTDNFVMPPSTPFRPPPKTTNPSKYKPTKTQKPSSQGIVTIQRPNGAGTLVIRQPPQPQRYKPQTTKRTTALTTTTSTTIKTTTKTTTTARPATTRTSTTRFPLPVENFVDNNNDLSASASVATGSWTSTPWQMTTQPPFVTKTKPSVWDKTTPTRTKPKPTKKPISFSSTNTRKPTTFKPKTPVKTVKPSTTQQTYAPTTTTTIRTTPTTTTTKLMSIPTTTTVTTTTQKTTALSTVPVLETSSLPPISLTPGRTTISASRSVDCGIPVLARPETRIVGGKNAPFGRWPWQVSVRRTSFFGFSSTHRCGGAVINENWIATAGHCVDDLLTSQIRIRVGEYDFSHVQELLPYTERAVSRKVVHPKYNFFTYEYDLALVKLDQPLEFAPHISPICLPGTDDLLIGENATVTGWGRLSEGGTLPSVLQEVSVPIVSNDRCKSMFLRAGRHEFIPDIFLCAGHENGGQDSCQGDSGGPLQVKSKDGHYFLAGIISWGIGCAEANLPGVCTRISKFVPWILQNVS